MSSTINIEPFKTELPSDYADRVGIYYTQQVSLKHKKDNGQFFTPLPIARLMSSYSDITNRAIKMLDPGCGTAILTCSLIEHIVKTKSNIEIIDLVAYERGK